MRGRRALITGGSRGIGRAIAEALAADGVDVALLARTEAASRDAVKACKKHGVRAFAVAADVADPVALADAVSAGAASLGGLDILVTSAGVGWMGATARVPDGVWAAMIDINLKGTMEAARVALPHLRASRAATMIFIGSVSSKMTYAGGAGYCASKHGLIGFAGALYEELRAMRIKVSTICPGTVDTDMTRAGNLGHDASQLLTAQDVAEAAMYVARSSPRACPSEIVLRCHHPQYN